MRQRTFSRFIGIDLGGGRGKTTVVAEVRAPQAGPNTHGHAAEVMAVATRAARGPWTDDALIAWLDERASELGRDALAVAIDAPLTQTACARCTVPACPGVEACVDPAVVWLRTEGRAVMAGEARAISSSSGGAQARRSLPVVATPQARLAPYAHRATDVVMTYERNLLPVTALGAPHGAIAARAHHLRRRLAASGFTLHDNLIEVSPAATICAVRGVHAARGYKRDADPWRTRAEILEHLAASGELGFAPQSRMAREDVLQNDHGFDAVIAAYTACLWAREGWRVPDGIYAIDGWIFAPS